MLSETEMPVEYLEEEIKSKPDSLLFSRLADSYRKSGDVQKAISISIKGLESHPGYITGRIILGRCYLEQENFNDAIKEFTGVCKLDRRNQIAIKMLADVFSKQGMEEKAGDLYQILLKMDPENVSLIHLAEVFSGTGKDNVFEILGIEDDIMKPAPPSAELEEEQGEIKEEQEETKDDQGEVKDVRDEVEEEPVEVKGEVEDVIEEQEEIKDSLEEVKEEKEEREEGEGEFKTEATAEGEDASINEILSVEAISSEDEPVREVPPQEPEISPEESDGTISEKETPAEAQDEMIPDKEGQDEDKDIEELLAPESTEEVEQTALPDQKKQDDIEVDVEEAAIDDISDRMNEMFADEEGRPVSAVVTASDEIEEEKTSPASTAMIDSPVFKEKQEEYTDSRIDELSSRVEKMFGEKRISEKAITEKVEEKDEEEVIEAPIDIDTLKPDTDIDIKQMEDIESTDKILMEEDGKTDDSESFIEVRIEEPEELEPGSLYEKEEPIQVLQKEEFESLDEIIEKDKTGDVDSIEPGLLGIDESDALSVEKLSKEQELSKASTELFEIEESSADFAEEPGNVEKLDEVLESDSTEDAQFPLEVEAEGDGDALEKTQAIEVPGLTETEATEEYTATKETIEEVSEDLITDATAVFDRDMIGRIASSIDNEQSLIAESPDSKEIVSRLDEIFKDEDKEKDILGEQAQEIETISEEDLPSGGEFAFHIDDMFPEEDTFDKDTLVVDSIPDDETGTDELVNEFYNKSGETAVFEIDETSSDEELVIEDDSSTASEVFLEKEQDEEDTLDIVKEDNILDNLSLESMSDEEDEELISEFYKKGETLETTDRHTEINLENDVDDIKSEEALQSLPKEDVLNSTDEIFLDDISPDTIPDDEYEKDQVTSDGFYDVSGEDAAVSSEDIDTSPASEDETAHEPVDDETEFKETDFLTEEEPKETVFQQGDTIKAKAESIPDHVLTPTLADIYYQQGQLYQAIQIYKRLLERDPDNDKIEDRILKIEQAIKEKEALAETAEKLKTSKRKSKKTKRGKTKDDKLPLKGIKIKKKFKARIRKTKSKGK
jgi:tetratricopeptide (TPR) repeat protein